MFRDKNLIFLRVELSLRDTANMLLLEYFLHLYNKV